MLAASGQDWTTWIFLSAILLCLVPTNKRQARGMFHGGLLAYFMGRRNRSRKR